MADNANPEDRLMIGLETHIQLNTKSKIFCGCRNPATLRLDESESEPNTITCPTCIGMPGSKPRANKAVVDMAIKVGIALGCSIAEETYFSRKTYFYPDMGKNFQITQYEVPIASKGRMAIAGKEIRITRVHMEEDPAKVVHVGGVGGKGVLVDYNRAGIPLLEIVTEPDFRSPAQAREYLQNLEAIFEYLGIYSPATKAVMKTDANISMGSERVEVKNITGSKEIERALNFEMARQKAVLSKGDKVRRETRMWDAENGITYSMRSKESEEDYGYIFEPDLSLITISRKKVDEAKKSLPELPEEKKARFMKSYGINGEIAESIVTEMELGNMFESVAKSISPKVAGSWIAGYLKKTLNYNELSFNESGLKAEWVMELLNLFADGKLTDRNCEMAMRFMVEEKSPPGEIIKKHNLAKGEVDLGLIAKKIVGENKKAVDEYKAGNEKSLHFIVGQGMREAKGKADANDIKKAILKIIG